MVEGVYTKLTKISMHSVVFRSNEETFQHYPSRTVNLDIGSARARRRI